MANPFVPKRAWHAKKLKSFKNALYASKKFTDDWMFSIKLTGKDIFAPKLDVTLQENDLLILTHRLLYGEDDKKMLGIKVTLGVSYQNTTWDWSQGLQSVRIIQDLSRSTKIFEKKNISIPNELLDLNDRWNRDNDVKSYVLSISVDVTNYAPLGDIYHLTRIVNQQLLNDTNFADLEITAMDGTSFPCHKIFLIVQSDVFAAMFTGKSFQEAQTDHLDLVDTPAEVVKSLLEFLYCGEIRGPMKNCEIAFWLLKTADKYNITRLRQIMSDMLCGKDNEWYNVDTALNLYKFLMYYRGTSRTKLINKALEVLAWKSKELEQKFKLEDMPNAILLKDMFLHSVKNLGHHLMFHQDMKCICTQFE